MFFETINFVILGMSFMQRLFCVLLLIFGSCSQETDSSLQNTENTQNNNHQENQDEAESILFIGNSLSFFNNGVDFHINNFYDLGEVNNGTYHLELSALPGYTLQNHLNHLATQNQINSRSWQKVILQENGVEVIEHPEASFESFREFANLFQSKPTQVYLFMTWAYEGHPEMTQQLYDFYKSVADETGFVLIPVGLGWRDLTLSFPEITLLNQDGVHPSLQGTFFSSAMIFEVISGQLSSQNPYNANLTEAQATTLKNQASEALVNYYY